jgi:hypothetical protein
VVLIFAVREVHANCEISVEHPGGGTPVLLLTDIDTSLPELSKLLDIVDLRTCSPWTISRYTMYRSYEGMGSDR